jgi:hypothetical protein
LHEIKLVILSFHAMDFHFFKVDQGHSLVSPVELYKRTFTASRAEKPSPATPPMYAHLQVSFFRAGRRVDGRHGELDVDTVFGVSLTLMTSSSSGR